MKEVLSKVEKGKDGYCEREGVACCWQDDGARWETDSMFLGDHGVVPDASRREKLLVWAEGPPAEFSVRRTGLLSTKPNSYLL